MNSVDKAKKIAESMTISAEQLLGLVMFGIISGRKYMSKTLEFLELVATNYKETLNKYCDNIIEFAIMYEQPEITAFLLDYKYKNGLYVDKDWEL